MRNRICALAVSAALLAMLTACGTTGSPRPATATDRSIGSLCLIDEPISYAAAPAQGIDDPGNQYDSDETVAALQEHNRRYRAACETDGEDGLRPE